MLCFYPLSLTLLISNINKRSILCLAIENQRTELILHLLDKNVDFSTQDSHSKYPINYVCDTGDFEMFKLFIDRGALPNNNCLLSAVNVRSLRMTQELIKTHLIDPNVLLASGS